MHLFSCASHCIFPARFIQTTLKIKTDNQSELLKIQKKRYFGAGYTRCQYHEMHPIMDPGCSNPTNIIENQMNFSQKK